MARQRFGRLALLAAAAVQIAGCPYFTDGIVPGAVVTTSLGEFVIELDPLRSPASVDNFLQYVDAGFYDGTIFHRVVPDFVVQGGGLTPDLVAKDTRPPIVNESTNGLRNLRGTVGMARGTDPNSATSQFYVNLADNAALDRTALTLGFAVFGRVVSGMDVVDRIGAVQTESRGGLDDVPVEDVVIISIVRTQFDRGPSLTPAGEAAIQNQLLQLANLLRTGLVQWIGFALID